MFMVAVIMGFAWLAIPMACHAQQGDATDLVYRFTLDDVQDQVEAKPVLKALLETPGVSACWFVPECACFKLATSQVLDRAAFSSLLPEGHRAAVNDVHVSDGRLLKASTTATDQ